MQVRKKKEDCRQFISDLVGQYRTRDETVTRIVQSVMNEAVHSPVIRGKPMSPRLFNKPTSPKVPDKPVLTPKTSAEDSNDISIRNDVSVHTMLLFNYKTVEIEQPKATTELFRLLQSLNLVNRQNEPVRGWERQLFREDQIVRTLHRAILRYSGRPNACHRELCLRYDSLSEVIRELLVLFEVTRASQRGKDLVCRDVLDLYLMVLSGDNDRMKTMLQPSQRALMAFSQWQRIGYGGLSRSVHLYANAVNYVLSTTRGPQRFVCDHKEEFWSCIERL